MIESKINALNTDVELGVGTTNRRHEMKNSEIFSPLRKSRTIFAMENINIATFSGGFEFRRYAQIVKLNQQIKLNLNINLMSII